jgi:hypothetical protein
VTLLGQRDEELSWHAAASSLGRVELGPSLGAVLSAERSDRVERVLFEGNRSVVVPSIEVALGDRRFHLSVKGVGARAPMFGDRPFRETPRVSHTRRITRESWMGEAPYGGQSEAGALAALELTRLAAGFTLEGFHLCPTLEVVEVPERLIDPEIAYRRYRGSVVQELRLVPSDVRLYAASDRTLGNEVEAVLAAFGVASTGDLEAFAERFAKTSLAAITLFARTLREGPSGLVGLDFDDVWLDKDAVIAPDGALFFVDLEALEWMPAWPSVEARVRRQIGRNAYEVLYALDLLLEVRERWMNRRPSRAMRRAAAIAIVEAALDHDPHVGAEVRGTALDLVVRAGASEHRVAFVDA